MSQAQPLNTSRFRYRMRVRCARYAVGGPRRSRADSLLIDNVDLTDVSIVDIGASDGSTSVDLIGRFPQFRSYVIADLFLSLAATTALGQVLFYDPIVGHRFVAWPSLSRGIRVMLSPLIAAAARGRRPRREVLMLNPAARSVIRSDERVTCAVQDVFICWPGPAPDVIKVASLLRRLYLDDQEISAALAVLLESLRYGGPKPNSSRSISTAGRCSRFCRRHGASHCPR